MSALDQINNTLAEMSDYRDKDLRDWPYSARRSLLKGGYILLKVPYSMEQAAALHVAAPAPAATAANAQAPAANTHVVSDTTEFYEYPAPKLAMVAASPVFRKFLLQHPNATQVTLANKRFKPKAVMSVASFLRAVVHVHDLMPVKFKLTNDVYFTDLTDTFDLYVAMELLQMHTNVAHLPTAYEANLLERTRMPQMREAAALVERAVPETQNSHGLLMVFLHLFATHLVKLSNANRLGLGLRNFIDQDENEKLRVAMAVAAEQLAKEV